MVSPMTVGVPVYNGEKYLDAALRSVMMQDLDMEILISDNGSTDSTPDICQSYTSDARVRYVQHSVNRGGVWNVNWVLSEAKHDIFKWAYYDDVLRDGYLVRCLDALDAAGPRAVAAHTRVVEIDKAGTVVAERDDADLRLDGPTPHERLGVFLSKLANQLEFAVMRTDALRRTGGIQPFIGSELAMLSALLMQGPAVQVCDQLLELRRHPDQYGATRLTEGAWYAHEKQRGRLMPMSWINVELLRSVRTSRLPVAEQMRCAQTVLRDWTLPRWRAAAADFKYLPYVMRGQ